MLLIGNGRLITRSQTNPYLEDGAVVLDGEAVQETGTLTALRAKYPQARFVDARGGVIMPGLINVHTHIYSGLARGLGSSSACIVAGLMGGNRLMGSPLSREDIIHMAATMEGHPDNSTPAILGGQVTAAIEIGRVFYCRQKLREDLRLMAIIPDFELKTSAARAALPKEVSRADGVFNLSRAALMAMSLAGGDYKNLRVAAQDKLHQPYRLELIPGARPVMDCALEFGAYCVYISGAGSTLMAMAGADNTGLFQRLRCWMDGQGYQGWRLHLLVMLEPDNDGAQMTVEEEGAA